VIDLVDGVAEIDHHLPQQRVQANPQAQLRLLGALAVAHHVHHEPEPVGPDPPPPRRRVRRRGVSGFPRHDFDRSGH
jgi:hypothetical protein